MKHFENVWEKAEEISAKIYTEDDINSIIDSIKIQLNNIKTCSQEEQAEILGNILFDLSNISLRLNINVFAALIHSINEHKIDLYEDNID